MERRQFLIKAGGAAALAASARPVLAESSPESHVTSQPDPLPELETNTSDILVNTLIEWGATHVFGIVGDGINPIIEALRKRKDEIAFVGVRHEEAAAFMASGMAKHTGKLGVCIATTGPGAVHLLNGLYDAAMEGAPVLAITGIINHDLLGTQFTQEVDTIKMLQDLAVYNQNITGPVHAQTVVDLACRAAVLTPGVAHITVSTDTQMKPLS